MAKRDAKKAVRDFALEMEVDATSMKKLVKQIRKLATRGFKKVLAAGARGFLSETAKGIRSEIPPHVRSLRKSVGYSFKYKKDAVIAKAGPNVGKRKTDKITKKGTVSTSAYVPHAHLYVLGSKPRYQKKSGRFAGVMPANSVVRRGSSKSISKAERMFKKKALIELKKQAVQSR